MVGTVLGATTAISFSGFCSSCSGICTGFLDVLDVSVLIIVFASDDLFEEALGFFSKAGRLGGV